MARKGEDSGVVLRQGWGLAMGGRRAGTGGIGDRVTLMAGLLYGVMPTDPLTLLASPCVLTGVALRTVISRAAGNGCRPDDA